MDEAKVRARNNAYILLRSRPRSEQEIRARLKLKGYDGTVIEEVLSGLKHTGDIDDRKFARVWVDSRMHLNPAGDVVLRHELKEKGVPEPIIEEALAEKAETYDEREIALNIARERFERLKRLDRKKATKRLYDFMIRRGFKYDTVRRVIEEIVK